MVAITPTSIRKCPCNNGLQLEVDCRLGSSECAELEEKKTHRRMKQKKRRKSTGWKLQRGLNRDDSETNKIITIVNTST